MTSPPRLEVLDLSEAECIALLTRKILGRMAFSFRDRVDLQPLMYAYRDGWVFGRTAEGEKLRTLQHNRWVAFQVDEIRDHWNWESVVVHGAVNFLGSTGGEEDRILHERALTALREVVPSTLTDTDPAPDRTVLFGLAVQEMAGRRAVLATPGTG